MPTETKIKLPKYIERAITSPTAKREPYSWLAEEKWREIAEHIYVDETVIPEGQSELFLQRGTQNRYGRTIRKTLFGILYSSVERHRGASNIVPHYGEAEKIFELFKATSKVKNSNISFSNLLKELNYFPEWM